MFAKSQDLRLHSCMIPPWLPIAQRAEFQKRWERALIRYREKYGNDPGFVGRGRILGGLMTAFKKGYVGNPSYGQRVINLLTHKRRRERAAREGRPLTDYYTYLRGSHKKRPPLVTHGERKETHKHWLTA